MTSLSTVDQFRRRVNRGKRHSVPYFGCREFSAHFGPPDGTEQSIDFTDDIGRMLSDLDYASDRSGRGTPRFFSARLEAGVLKVPAELYQRRE